MTATIQCTLGTRPLRSTSVHVETAAGVGKAHDASGITANFAWPGWWYDPNAGDFGWPDVAAESDLASPPAYPGLPALPGFAQWVVPPSMDGPQFPVGSGAIWRTWVYRYVFSLPAGVVSAAALQFVGYENIFGLWINGNVVTSGTINPADFRPGALNLLAAGIQMQPYGVWTLPPFPPTCLAWHLDVTVGTPTSAVRFTTPAGVTGRLLHV